jgi:splicing factor 3A subunit 2
MDMQNRVGSKIGGGGMMSESQQAVARRERLRKLAMETMDLSKDPYIMRNNLGTFECKLCLTIHPNEGHYLAHTQAGRHQGNLTRRAAQEDAKRKRDSSVLETKKKKEFVKTIKIGKPLYAISKGRDVHNNQRYIAFEIDYPQYKKGIQPRHRFMSAFEQKVEAVQDKDVQYLVIACEPYETIAFKVPSAPIDKSEGKFHFHFDEKVGKFAIKFYYL